MRNTTVQHHSHSSSPARTSLAPSPETPPPDALSRTPRRRRPVLTAATVVTTAVACLALGACGSNPPQADGGKKDSSAGKGGSGAGGAADVALPKLKKDPALHKMLPEKIRKAGKMTSVNNGSFPPYEIAGSDGHSLTGASADMATALGQLLGVKIHHVTADGLPSSLTGIKAGRYDVALGPVGDFKDRQKSNDFVDWVQEYVVFAVKKGNPEKIGSLADTCGRRVAVMSGGSAEGVIKEQAERCKKDGKEAVRVQSYKDQPGSILAVRSGRADAFFSSQAPLAYFVKEAKGTLELAGTGKANGFDDLYQGAVVPKKSPLREVLVKAIGELIDNGTYAKIMKKWGTTSNSVEKPGVNLGGEA
ncbi:polar amino acid transport system substrate-binding protein [Streptomyces sp. Amel2xB2]|uniref:ABC transporter substrate-binding protein n=1 Tax=Streptomyces sp. Amel2xB2 TaxID=1305829 RepID=UPI000DB99A73|nr:ABC transporter substrate-binding protein [Streptomyces sp. Amel2xB2]RAJ71397.1 polar amino acid transport system substrate-binding protein [Streptomyces sp. Amel2xB2]